MRRARDRGRAATRLPDAKSSLDALALAPGEFELRAGGGVRFLRPARLRLEIAGVEHDEHVAAATSEPARTRTSSIRARIFDDTVVWRADTTVPLTASTTGSSDRSTATVAASAASLELADGASPGPICSPQLPESHATVATTRATPAATCTTLPVDALMTPPPPAAADRPWPGRLR